MQLRERFHKWREKLRTNYESVPIITNLYVLKLFAAICNNWQFHPVLQRVGNGQLPHFISIGAIHQDVINARRKTFNAHLESHLPGIYV